MTYPELSKAQIHSLAKLKQKKIRLGESLVVVEGRRSLEQLATWGIHPTELYILSGETPLQAETIYSIRPEAMFRICESENPPAVAGLFSLPVARVVDFQTAFYLDEISDPGNLGTIFRIAAAFNIDTVIMSPNCCEISSPKVIRSSLGAVYQVPFRVCKVKDLSALKAQIVALDMKGSMELQDLHPGEKALIVALGSEAHGLSPELKSMASSSIRITMPGAMESLNAAVCAGIVAFQLQQRSC